MHPVVIGDRLQLLMLVIVNYLTILPMRCVQYQTTFSICPSIFTLYEMWRKPSWRSDSVSVCSSRVIFLMQEASRRNWQRILCSVDVASHIRQMIILVSSLMPHLHAYRYFWTYGTLTTQKQCFGSLKTAFFDNIQKCAQTGQVPKPWFPANISINASASVV